MRFLRISIIAGILTALLLPISIETPLVHAMGSARVRTSALKLTCDFKTAIENADTGADRRGSICVHLGM